MAFFLCLGKVGEVKSIMFCAAEVWHRMGEYLRIVWCFVVWLSGFYLGMVCLKDDLVSKWWRDGGVYMV